MILKRKATLLALILTILIGTVGCEGAERSDREHTDGQQSHYQIVQPRKFYEYSIPLDVLSQIYDMVIEQAVATYTVVETVTGELKWQCNSIGFAIPVDTQLTNPLRPAYSSSSGSVIEQAEPSGLFSSKNTDGTWVLCVDDDSGTAYPHYTEHKVSVWPFPVVRLEDGSWLKLAGAPIDVVIDTTLILADMEERLEILEQRAEERESQLTPNATGIESTTTITTTEDQR